MELRKVENSVSIVTLEVNINLLIRKIKIIKGVTKRIFRLIIFTFIYTAGITGMGCVLAYICHVLYDIL